jgi:O-antigen biosynthesis protein WbqP
MGIEMNYKNPYTFVKRILDLILSLIATILLSPVFLFIAVSIKLDSPGPVLFQQKRIGKNKAFFQIYKYRTMSINTPKDAPTHLLGNPDAYITKVGGFLRKTSLDEIPQLWNIIKGEMSIVGPRPALWNQDDLIEEREKYGVNALTPGLTGWAQINGRDELSIEDKAKLDGEYAKNIGLRMDVKCIWETIKVVLKRDGIVEGGPKELNKK